MAAFRIFRRFNELLDIAVSRAEAVWLRLNADGSVSQRTAAETRTDLGLGNSATLNTGTTPGTVAAGDDSRFTDARTPTAHDHVVSDITPVSGRHLIGRHANGSGVGDLRNPRRSRCEDCCRC